jgi:hypothetical protein
MVPNCKGVISRALSLLCQKAYQRKDLYRSWLWQDAYFNSYSSLTVIVQGQNGEINASWEVELLSC